MPCSFKRRLDLLATFMAEEVSDNGRERNLAEADHLMTMKLVLKNTEGPDSTRHSSLQLLTTMICSTCGRPRWQRRKQRD